MTGEPPTVDGAAAPDALVGTVLADRYRIEKRIGEGGMGTVYLARHVLLEKVVALKVLHDEYARRRELVERFLHEAKAASRIRHEHVIDITDFGETSTKNVFFAMEYLEGHELATELDRSGTLPWPRIKKIMLQLCSALQAAHEAGVIHRDLKPENIFLIEKFGNPEFVKVLDFGVAKLTEFDDKTRRLTRTGMVFGTPEYMSPEQARGDKPDTRVDVYACGCILYEMVTGQVPFTGDSFMGVLTKQMFDPVPRLAERVQRKDLPPGLQAVLDEALAKNREERFSSMNELAVAIDTLDNLAGVVYAAPGASPGSAQRKPAQVVAAPLPTAPPPRPAPSAVLAPMPVASNQTVRMSVAPVALTPAQRPAAPEPDRAATIPWTPPPPPTPVAPIAVAQVVAPPPPRPVAGLTPAPFGDMGIQFDDDTASLRLPVNKRRRMIIGGSVVAAVAAVVVIAVATSGGGAAKAPETAVAAAAPPAPPPPAAAQPVAAVVPTPAPATAPVAVVAPPDAPPVAVAAPPDAKPPVAVVAPRPDAAPVAVAPPPVAPRAVVVAEPPAPAHPKVAKAPPPSVTADAPDHKKKTKKKTASAAPPPPETFPPAEPKAEKKKPPAAKPKSDLKDPFAD